MTRDERWMRHALMLAARAKGETRPNPCVGAVIVSAAGELLGEGWHRRAGQPHAEVEAIRDARERGNETRGATMYVTLEPCNHQGLTPPCTQAVLDAGIARLVAAMRDPNSKAAGGLGHLRERGVEVASGVCEEDAMLLNAEFITFHALRRPLVTLKWAMTMDGCTSLDNGESFWITGEKAREQVHHSRAAHDAVLAGIGAVQRDDARLTVRVEGTTFKPLRVVLDSQLKLSATSAFAQARDGSRAVVVCGGAASAANESALRAGGVEVWRCGESGSGIDLGTLMQRLHAEQVQSLYVEGGRTVAGSFLAAGLVDRVQCWIAPKIFGGGTRPLGPVVFAQPLESVSAATIAHHTTVAQVGPDVILEGWITRHLFGKESGTP